jgi:hypothetical protein
MTNDRERLYPVLARDDSGQVLDAEYSVEQDGEQLALILESASGPADSRPPRNTDYRSALTLLLGRLRALGAVLHDGLVDSAFTQRRGIPEAERRLLPSPIRLVDETDMEALRLRLTSGQSRIGQAPGISKGGNSSKRIRLRLAVPGFSPEDAGRLAAELLTPAWEVSLSPSPEGSRAGQAVPEDAVTPVEETPFEGDGRVVDKVATQSAEAEQVAEAVAQAAGKFVRRGRGQGFQVDQDVKVATEAHAMNAATEFYCAGWAVEDVHGNESYDLICRRGGEVKHVEVKGTTTDGAEIILTPNEVRHAREYPCTALFVVSNITVERADDGTVTATGGEQHLYDPWHIDDGTLMPLGFRYQGPDSPCPAGS